MKIIARGQLIGQGVRHRDQCVYCHEWVVKIDYMTIGMTIGLVAMIAYPFLRLPWPLWILEFGTLIIITLIFIAATVTSPTFVGDNENLIAHVACREAYEKEQ